MAVTQMPVPGNRFECDVKMNNSIPAWKFVETVLKRCMIYWPRIGGQMMMSKEYKNMCGDYLYSGHTIQIVIGIFAAQFGPILNC